MKRNIRSTRPVSWKLLYEFVRIDVISQMYHSLLPAIIVTKSRQTSKCALASDHRVGEDHQESTDNGEIAKEKVDVEDEAVAKTLEENDTQEASHCDFRVPLHDNAP